MSLLVETSIFLAAAVIAVPIFKRLGLGSVLGYLAAGSLIGPWCLGLISDVEDILHFSEIGVVLLLFIIGLELKPARLWRLRKSVFGLGLAQVLFTAMVLSPIAWMTGMSLETCIIVGLGLSLSSTAFAIQMLAEKNQLTKPHGRASFAVLLFQDLAVAPLLALVTLLAPGSTAESSGHPLWTFLQVVGCFVLMIFIGRFVLRPLFRYISESRLREIFTACALLVVLSTGLLMHAIGLSMALGAFLAGVLLADSEYRHELEADIEPFKGLLLGLFFLAVGMSVNYGLILTEPGKVALYVFLLLAIKMSVLFGLGKAAKLSTASAMTLAVALSQGGEFAFVLFGAAEIGGVLPTETAELLIVVVTISMALTPFLFLLKEKFHRKTPQDVPDYDKSEKDVVPVIIAGFGRFGQITARILRAKRIPFTALESSSAQVDFVAKFGTKIHYGDVSRVELLHAAKAESAAIFILAIDDVEKSVQTAKTVKKHFPKLKIYARARNRKHAYRLIQIGVEEVIRETYYSGLEMTKRVLIGLGLTYSNADDTVVRFKNHDEQLLLSQAKDFENEAKLISTAKQAAIDLEKLFEKDQEAERHG